jgi:hypothetical protein
MDLNARLREALTAPPGAHADLVAPALAATLANQLPRELADTAQKVDQLLRHLTGGRSWAPELVASKASAMALDRFLALGFRDATFADVEAFSAVNDIAIARIFRTRLGTDSAEALLALAERSPSGRVKHAARAATIAGGHVPPGIEAGLVLREVNDNPLIQSALERLGPERASEVTLRELRQFDDEPQFRAQALIPVLRAFGAPLTPAALDALAERTEELAHETSWHGIGDSLADSLRFAECIAFVRARAAKTPGWRKAMVGLLARAVQVDPTFQIDPSLDEFIDCADTAKNHGYDQWKLVTAVLRALPRERAVPLLIDAQYADPGDVFRFPVEGLPQPALEKIAAAHVARGALPDAKHFLIATRLQPYGPGFGDALRLALADVKPKPAYLKALERNLDPSVWQPLQAWLTARPEPKPKKKPAEKKVAK